MTKRRQNYMKRADALFSRLIRERDQTCVAAQAYGVACKGNLQCAHLISRSYKSIRCDFDNAVAACAAHHTYFTHRPLEWREWVEWTFPGRWDRLQAQALRYEKVDWRARLAELKEIAENMGIAA